jgi:ATP-dependent Clp protease ATP-binding subunit ClpA
MLYDKLTQNAYDAVIWSQNKCEKLGYREVTTLDILLALINQKTGIITQVIQAAKITPENIRLESEKIDTRKVGFCSEPGFSPDTRQVFEFALQESEN